MRLARLDGIRALAILLVLLFHHSFGFGSEGVDLFFVLSGFLITNILRKSRTSDSYWSRFYTKRAARILPSLVLLFLGVVLISARWSPLALLGYSVFLANILNWTSYSVPLLTPLWSLAVEEHFYLIWPAVVRKCSDTRLLRIALAVVVAAPILRAIVTPFVHSVLVIYELTPFRLDGLAAGALLALLLDHAGARTRLERWSGPAFVLVTTLYVIPTFLVSSFNRKANDVLFNSLGYSLVTIACFLLVATVVLSESGWVHRLFSLPPVAYFGRISYGVYLYSLCVTSVLKHALHIPFGGAGDTASRLIFLPDLILTIALCAFSFNFIEQPILRWAERFSSRHASAPSHERAAIAPLTS